MNQAWNVAMHWRKHMSQGQAALLEACVSVFHVIVTSSNLRQRVLGQPSVTSVNTQGVDLLTCRRVRTLTFLFVQVACKIPSVCLCECVCIRDGSPSKYRPHNDFQSELKSILPAFSLYTLHIVTPPRQPAVARCQRSIFALHCAPLYVV